MSVTLPHAIFSDSGTETADIATSHGAFTFGDLLALQAETRPDQPFLTDQTQHVTHSFAQAHTSVTALATFLAGLGLEQNAIVGVLTPNQPEAVLTLLACLNAGLRPLMLPAHGNFSNLSSMMLHAAPDALIAGPSASPCHCADMAVRLAATHDSVRYVMAYGDTVPNGVVALTHIEATPRAAHIQDQPPATAILCARGKGEPVALAIDPLIAAATDHAAEAGISHDDRILMPFSMHSLHALSCGIGTALMTGAALTLLDAPDSTALTQALIGGHPVRLIWPGQMEDILADMPPRLVRSVTLIHQTPWERQTHRGMNASVPFALIDAWNFDDRVMALVTRQNTHHPAHPRVLQRQPDTPQANAGAWLAQDDNGRLLAAGPAVQTASANSWLDLGIMLFRDHHGAIVAYENIATLRQAHSRKASP